MTSRQDLIDVFNSIRFDQSIDTRQDRLDHVVIQDGYRNETAAADTKETAKEATGR